MHKARLNQVFFITANAAFRPSQYGSVATIGLSRVVVVARCLPRSATRSRLRTKTAEPPQPSASEMTESMSAVAPGRRNKARDQILYAVCHGDAAEIGLSRMPMARNRRLTTGP